MDQSFYLVNIEQLLYCAMQGIASHVHTWVYIVPSINQLGDAITFFPFFLEGATLIDSSQIFFKQLATQT